MAVTLSHVTAVARLSVCIYPIQKSHLLFVEGNTVMLTSGLLKKHHPYSNLFISLADRAFIIQLTGPL